MSRLIVIPNSGHIIYNDNPKALANCIINEFLSYDKKDYQFLPYLSEKEYLY